MHAASMITTQEKQEFNGGDLAGIEDSKKNLTLLHCGKSIIGQAKHHAL